MGINRGSVTNFLRHFFDICSKGKLKSFNQKPEGKGQFMRSKTRLEYIKMDLRERGCEGVDRIHRVLDAFSGRNLWRRPETSCSTNGGKIPGHELSEMINNFYVPRKVLNILYYSKRQFTYLKERLQSLQTNSVALGHKRTIPTERPPLVGKVSANFYG
jgi:hypothetical protein